MSPELLLAFTPVVLLLGGYGAWRLWASHRRDRAGRLGAVDLDRALRTLRSPAWRISGRPDELRLRPDGSPVPVEWKSRRAPSSGPFRSHRVQLLAYLALAEAETGRSPPFGLLRYSDGSEFRIVWDARARDELRRWRAAIARPYRGEADPAPEKCRGCRWRSICDARAV